MPRFDVYRLGGGSVVDCQADVHRHLKTRFVVPMQENPAFPRKGHLNPVFTLGERQLVMMTEFASTVLARELGEKLGSLADDHDRIVAAIDFLIAGY